MITEEQMISSDNNIDTDWDFEEENTTTEVVNEGVQPMEISMEYVMEERIEDIAESEIPVVSVSSEASSIYSDTRNQAINFSISTILTMLKNGYTRTPEDKGYDAQIGSIMEFYNVVDKPEITAKGIINLLFKHPKLKGKKTIIKRTAANLGFTIIDDTVEEVVIPQLENQEQQ